VYANGLKCIDDDDDDNDNNNNNNNNKQQQQQQQQQQQHVTTFYQCSIFMYVYQGHYILTARLHKL